MSLSQIQPWKLLSSDHVLRSKWCIIRKDKVLLPNEVVVDDYYVAVRPDVVMIFAMNSNQEVLLVKQYKHGVQQITWELPGGTCDDGEHPAQAAARELLEETGYACSDLIGLGFAFDDATRNTNKVHVFLGLNASPKSAQNLDKNESAAGLHVSAVPACELLPKIRAGEIAAQSSVMSIYRALHEHSLLPDSISRGAGS